MATNRQLAQGTRQNRQHRRRQATAGPSNRELAQRARQNRELPLTQQRPANALLAQQACQERQRQHRVHQLPIARQPLLPHLNDTTSLRRHRLDRCNIVCSFCGADHWIEERVQGTAKSAPQFSRCCEGGTIMMDKFEDLSRYIRS
jgi:hypothetical protein